MKHSQKESQLALGGQYGEEPQQTEYVRLLVVSIGLRSDESLFVKYRNVMDELRQLRNTCRVIWRVGKIVAVEPRPICIEEQPNKVPPT